MKCLHFKVTLIFVKDTMYCYFFYSKKMLYVCDFLYKKVFLRNNDQ